MTYISEYSKDEVVDLNLGNRIPCYLDRGISEGEEDMPKRIREKVLVGGKARWIGGYSVQEVMDNYVRLLVQEGIVEMVDEGDQMPLFGDYMSLYYSTYKQKQQKNTVVNRERIIRNHILPRFGNKRLDRIQTIDIQQFFNAMGKKYAKETLLKVKNIMNPVFESAVEDELITRNPLASHRLEISGKTTIHHKAIPRDKMIFVKSGLENLDWRERAMGGLLCYTGMRFEEVLGIKWEDICDGWITIRRAVVHPNRNLPEVKCPKTKTSERKIPMHEDLGKLLETYNGKRKGYLLTAMDGKSPLSYTEARRSFDKIRKKFDISEYTAHDFRDTCATEWRENGISLDVIARLLGHSKTETTEKRYVKYRDEGMLNDVRGMM